MITCQIEPYDSDDLLSIDCWYFARWLNPALDCKAWFLPCHEEDAFFDVTAVVDASGACFEVVPC